MEVILTHENTDFDALASLLGASKLFPNAIPVLPRRINRNGQGFLALYSAELPFMKPEDLPRGKITHAILVDTQSLTTLRGMGRDLQVDILQMHDLLSGLEAGAVGGENHFVLRPLARDEGHALEFELG